ncbi:MAG: hypothetical protein IJS60_02310 [Abditibacteriota bacterium]|nr:hypothetical protein [Abditibacteriota bacterium]
MKKTFLSFLILILTICAFGECYDEPRQRLDPDDFIIFPWGDKFSTEPNMNKYLQGLYDCGFNLTNHIDAKYVRYAHKYHLKAILDGGLINWDIKDYKERALDYTQKIIKEVGKDYLKDLYFVYVQDEPTMNENTKERLVAFSDAIKENIKCRPQINLFPTYATEEQLGTNNYDEYLDYFTKACKLDYISYDNYSISFNVKPNVPGITYTETGAGFDENEFYGNLEAVRNASIRNRVKFINIIQSIGALHLPPPDDYIIHVQGWSTLAYGGRGLSYFTYTTGPGLGNNSEGPFDEYGMKSPTYRYVAHMNFAIHNIGAIYKNLKNINVYHIGNVPKGCKNESSAINVKKLQLHSIKGTPNVVVGEFLDRDKKQYAIIVNKDPKYSVAISIEFNKGDKIYKVEDRSIGAQVKPFGGEDTYIMPGHGVLLYAE